MAPAVGSVGARRPSDYATNNDPALAALIAESLDRNPQVRASVPGALGGTGACRTGHRAAGSDGLSDAPPAYAGDARRSADRRHLGQPEIPVVRQAGRPGQGCREAGRPSARKWSGRGRRKWFAGSSSPTTTSRTSIARSRSRRKRKSCCGTMSPLRRPDIRRAWVCSRPLSSCRPKSPASAPGGRSFCVTGSMPRRR